MRSSGLRMGQFANRPALAVAWSVAVAIVGLDGWPLLGTCRDRLG